MKWFYKDPQGEIQGRSSYFSSQHTMGFCETLFDLCFVFVFCFFALRSVYSGGDVRVVPGWLLHHDLAGKERLRRRIPAPGRRH